MVRAKSDRLPGGDRWYLARKTPKSRVSLNSGQVPYPGSQVYRKRDPLRGKQMKQGRR